MIGTIRPYLAFTLDVIASKSGPEVTSLTVPVTGVVPAASQLTGTDSGVLVELNCETDFVAKTGLFQQAAGEIARTALGGQITSRLALLSAEVAPGRTVEELIDAAGATLKENLRLGRYAHFEGGFVASYEHRSV